MKFKIEGTDEIRELNFHGTSGAELGPETIVSDGTEIELDRKSGAYIISLSDFARWRRIIERIEAAEKALLDTVRRITRPKNAARVKEIVDEEIDSAESVTALPDIYERLKTRLEDELEIPLCKRINRIERTARK